MLKAISFTLCSIAMLFSINASAGILTFSDLASWTAASGGATGSENFNSFTTDTSISAGVALSDGISASGSGSWEIDANPFANNFECDVDGTSRLCGNNNSALTFSFAGGISAFAADFSSMNDFSVRTSWNLFNGSTLLTNLSPPTVSGQHDQFWGFVATAGEVITSMSTVHLNSDTFGVDNIVITASSVPEPGTLILLSLGLFGISVRRRKSC